MVINPQTELLREPNLLAPGKQPVGRVKVDTTNLFGAAACYGFIGQQVEVMGRQPWQRFGNRWVPNSDAELVSNRWTCNSDSDALIIDETRTWTVPAAQPFTCLMKGIWRAKTLGSYRYFFAWKVYTAFSLYSNNAFSIVYVNSAQTAVSVNAPSAGDSFTIVARCHPYSGSRLFLMVNDGAVQEDDMANRASANYSGTDNPTWGGRDTSTGRYAGCDLETGFLFDRTFTDEECRALVRDPYQFLVPE